MKIVVGSDELRPIVAHMASWLRARGHDVVEAPVGTWGEMATQLASRVAAREFDTAIVCCWTGTGASIAANKVAQVRAALCTDAATAKGARQWNDANVLALSLRLLSEPVAEEILTAWTETPYAGTEDESLRVIERSESTKLTPRNL